MDRQIEDKMVKQIEKNLSNNLSQNLFNTGQLYERNHQGKYNADTQAVPALPAEAATMMENPIISFDYSNPISISRAEYIRQAREACLRQLSELQTTARAYDSYYIDNSFKSVEDYPQTNSIETVEKSTLPIKMHKANTTSQVEDASQDNIKEIVAFRLLIARMVFAIVIFLSVFLIDKFDFKFGSISSESIQEYVTGNDTLDSLENMIVTLLKK